MESYHILRKSNEWDIEYFLGGFWPWNSWDWTNIVSWVAEGEKERGLGSYKTPIFVVATEHFYSDIPLLISHTWKITITFKNTFSPKISPLYLNFLFICSFSRGSNIEYSFLAPPKTAGHSFISLIILAVPFVFSIFTDPSHSTLANY